MGGELGDIVIGPSLMEYEGGRGVRGMFLYSKYNGVMVRGELGEVLIHQV